MAAREMPSARIDIISLLNQYEFRTSLELTRQLHADCLRFLSDYYQLQQPDHLLAFLRVYCEPPISFERRLLEHYRIRPNRPRKLSITGEDRSLLALHDELKAYLIRQRRLFSSVLHGAVAHPLNRMS